MLDILGWYIIRLLTLISSTPPPITYILPLGTLTSQSFFDRICDASQETRNRYFVKSIKWYRQSSGPEHDFLVACLSNSHFVLVEPGKSDRRLPGLGKFISTFASSQSLLSSEACLAKDNLRTVEDLSLTALIEERIYESTTSLLMEHKFRDLKLLEFARLVNIVSKNQQNYQIDGSIYHWFASMVVAIAKVEFHGRLKGFKANLKLAGKNKSLTVSRADQNEVNEIRSIYVKARCHDPEPLGPREISNQRKITELKAKIEAELHRERQETEDRLEEKRQEAEEKQQEAEDRLEAKRQEAEDRLEAERQEAEVKQQELLEEIAALKRQQRN